MKFRVMIVDDEPPFIRGTKRMIEKSSPLYEIVGESYNGAEALEKIPVLQPDLIFSDIKMPVMDGITFVKELHIQYPSIIPVIISGYQEFDFAKEALKSGVVEYLLKPVEPEALVALLINLAPKLEQVYHDMGVQLLRQMMNSRPAEELTRTCQIKHFLNFDTVTPFLIRAGSLPCRYNNNNIRQPNPILLSAYVTELKQLTGSSHCLSLGGQDENELLVICGWQTEMQPNWNRTTAAKLHSHFNGIPPVTVIYSDQSTHLKDLAPVVQLLYKTLNQCLIVGKGQLLTPENLEQTAGLPLPIISKHLETQLTLLIQNKSLHLLQQEIQKLFHLWEQNSYPQIWVEKYVKQLMRFLERYAPASTLQRSLNIELQIEEVFYYATDFEGLLDSVWDIIVDLFDDDQSPQTGRNNGEYLLGKIESYLKLNMAEAISLQSVCEAFSISQPYLSRLFRKHRNLSFNEYLTKIRIDEACRLLKSHPGMLFKEIAEIVGYQDHHYFSRIFKLLTGRSPSEYKDKL